FVTGAGRGIGLEVAKAALAAGDRVVATGRDRARVEQALAADPDRVLAVELDITVEAQAFRAVEAAVDRFGGIDVLVNNAGYGQLGAFEENDAADVERQFETNVFGTFHVTRAVLPAMRRQRAGRIFNVSSVGGVIGVEGGSIYCAAKFAVEGFSESLAQEVARFGIHVTIVEPGYFRTDFLDRSSARYGAKVIDDYARSSAELRANFDAHSHRQAGDPAKLAAALVILAGENQPPLRFPAGSDAVEWILGKLAAMRGEIDRGRELSVSTD